MGARRLRGGHLGCLLLNSREHALPAGAAALLPRALAFGADTRLPKFDSPAAVEAFFFPADEEAIFTSMQAVFGLDNPGMLVTAAANLGPAYATKVAETIASPEFRRHYARLAEYLDLFGPCQKKQNPDREGWWSRYADEPGEGYCGEATKLVFAATLWSQAHYCRQLATGEAKPKGSEAPPNGPPYRLDEPPVRTQWIRPAAVYAVTDAAVETRFAETLRKRAATLEPGSDEREAVLDAARELDAKPVTRELAGLALLKMMIRRYEAVHARHMRERQSK